MAWGKVGCGQVSTHANDQLCATLPTMHANHAWSDAGDALLTLVLRSEDNAIS